MKKQTVELVKAYEAFDAAEQAFFAVVKVWRQRGAPEGFTALDLICADYAAALVRFRAAISAASKPFPNSEDVP